MMQNENQYQQQQIEEEPEEKLISTSEVIGLKLPEHVISIDAEKEVADEAIKNESPYETWLRDKSQKNLVKAVDFLKPTINSVLATYGASGNPQIASKARVIAAKAVSTYDPSQGVSLPTYVSSQLRQLTRDIRKSNNVLSIPEGVQLDSYALYKAEREFEDEYGREPTVDELADKVHLSVKRIKDIRLKNKAVLMDSSTTSEAGTEYSGTSESDYSKDALDYVYNESDTTDKKLLEYLTGYGGITPLDNKAIMQKLKLTPVQLTRRKARLSLKIKDIIDNLEKV